MTRSIHIATVQMDVRPASTGGRLMRADEILCDAVELGAELVVLPELFNTGYIYSSENFARAETPDGPTLNWMKRTAHRHGVYLAGSLLLAENGEIYNALYLVAPNGRTWRYDKSYPWGWERGYFRENPRSGPARAVIAETELGNFGMLICWDVAHTELWQAYAGSVDGMIIATCPPEISRPAIHLSSGDTLTSEHLGAQWKGLEGEEQRIFSTMLAEQTAWLGVPAAVSAACGTFESPIPAGRATLMGLVPGQPGLLRYLPQSAAMQMQARMTDACRIISAQGQPLAHYPQEKGEGFAHTEVSLADARPQPRTTQPAGRASRTAALFADTYLPKVMKSTYEQGLRQLSKPA